MTEDRRHAWASVMMMTEGYLLKYGSLVDFTGGFGIVFDGDAWHRAFLGLRFE